MGVEKLPDLQQPIWCDICDRARPVLSYTWYAEGAHRAARHTHVRAHIICPQAGAYWVVTPAGTWLVPAGLAIWIPPLVPHEVYTHGSASARIFFVDQFHAEALPARCGTVKVSPFLDALLSRAVEYGNDYTPESPAARLARVLLDELAAMEFAPILLPISKNPRVARIMERLIEDPERADGFAQLAREAAVSPRTLARLFRRETGMTLTQWKTNLRLAEAIKRLARGATVTDVALDLGYGSTSSFIYMFRSRLGVPPGHYRIRGKAGATTH